MKVKQLVSILAMTPLFWLACSRSPKALCEDAAAAACDNYYNCFDGQRFNSMEDCVAVTRRRMKCDGADNGDAGFAPAQAERCLKAYTQPGCTTDEVPEACTGVVTLTKTPAEACVESTEVGCDYLVRCTDGGLPREACVQLANIVRPCEQQTEATVCGDGGTYQLEKDQQCTEALRVMTQCGTTLPTVCSEVCKP
jgi:hypothetical protein